MMMRVLASLSALALLAGCSDLPPTAPSNARIMLAISQPSLAVGGTAIVTATVRELTGAPVDGALVSFSGSLGTLAPKDVYTDRGIATTTYTATQSGTGAINALSGSVSAEHVQVRVGELSLPPEIDTPPLPPALPTMSLSCPSGIVGELVICAVSGFNVQSIAITWGDGSPEQSFIPGTASVAHAFGRADRYTVSARGGNTAGQVATASAIADVVTPPQPPPPPSITPRPQMLEVFFSQEANAGATGCAAFNVGATAGPGASITGIVVTQAGVTVAGPFTSSTRFVLCGLTPNTTILTATATDSTGGTARSQLLVH
jgi:hypothetical protein